MKTKADGVAPNSDLAAIRAHRVRNTEGRWAGGLTLTPEYAANERRRRAAQSAGGCTPAELAAHRQAGEVWCRRHKGWVPRSHATKNSRNTCICRWCREGVVA